MSKQKYKVSQQYSVICQLLPCACYGWAINLTIKLTFILASEPQTQLSEGTYYESSQMHGYKCRAINYYVA